MKRSWAAAVGVVAGVFTVGVATLLAALMAAAGLAGGAPSPVFAVGGAFVDRTPPWLKDFATTTFGTKDKTVLIVGMALFLIVVCAIIGMVGARRRTAGMVAFGVLGVRIAIFYVGSLVLLSLLLPFTAYKAGESPFVTFFGSIGIEGAAPIMNLVVLTAAMSSLNAGLYSTGRTQPGQTTGCLPRFARSRGESYRRDITR